MKKNTPLCSQNCIPTSLSFAAPPLNSTNSNLLELNPNGYLMIIKLFN